MPALPPPNPTLSPSVSKKNRFQGAPRSCILHLLSGTPQVSSRHGLSRVRWAHNPTLGTQQLHVSPFFPSEASRLEPKQRIKTASLRPDWFLRGFQPYWDWGAELSWHFFCIFFGEVRGWSPCFFIPVFINCPLFSLVFQRFSSIFHSFQ